MVKTMNEPAHDVADLDLAPEGRKRIEWADRDMPVLAAIREQFAADRPLEGLKLSACLHITKETANLARTLKAGGADVVLCASNPLSTQDEVAASLVADFAIPVFAVRGEDRDTYYAHIEAALDHRPHVTMDDGADLVSAIHEDRPALTERVIASMEETTTGVIRLRAMAADGALKIPVVAVNDARTKNLFDNKYGTGQSTLDGIIRATDKLIAGTTFVVCGYGNCGQGIAERARGLGARVVVCEVDPLRALQAAMNGFMVMPIAEAARKGDIFVTVTGDKHVLRGEHFAAMKDDAIVANSGHFDVELEIPALEEMATSVERGTRDSVDTYVLENGNEIHLLAQGRLVNLAAATGHPASVMDMSFATQALTTAWAAENRDLLEERVHDVPRAVEERVAAEKLAAMGIEIDELTPEQEAYLASWDEGT